MVKRSEMTEEQIRSQFKSLISIKEENGKVHWIWSGPISEQNGNKLGYFNYRGKTVSASRAAWLLYKGEVPPKKQVRKSCSVDLCVNPECHNVPQLNKAPQVIPATNSVKTELPQPDYLNPFSPMSESAKDWDW